MAWIVDWMLGTQLVNVLQWLHTQEEGIVEKYLQSTPPLHSHNIGYAAISHTLQ